MPPPSQPAPRDPLVRLAVALAGAARSAHQRRALVLSGDPVWGQAAAVAALRAAGLNQALWIGASSPSGLDWVAPGAAGRWLGRETDALVIDAHAGLDPDDLGAASGAVRAGGLLLLLAPPLERWPQLPDPQLERICVHPWRPEQLRGRFLRRLAALLRQSPDLVLVEQGRPMQTGPSVLAPSSARPSESADPECRTADQRRAVEAVERVARGHRRRPLVISSDRGRGKSAAFGIAAARLLRAGLQQILVTGPRLEAVEPLFRHAATLLPGGLSARGLLTWQGRRIEFRAPEALLREQPAEAELLLVDEAAALPLPLLERLLAGFARIAFATTVHGYEGSGRGFALRFVKTLDARTPGWRALRLTQPIRWAEQDPVERLVFRALVLDAEVTPPEALSGASLPGCTLERIERDRLASDETLLTQLFGLLVLAHYRTRPFDLRQLLDGPSLSVLAMRYGEHLVGVALLAREGGLGQDMAHAIWAGRRRLRGHLIAQSLAAHVGVAQGACLVGERVMRIAIHPAVQGRGLGQALLGAAVETARGAGADWLGTSFGATPELIAFWRRAGARPVRIGLTREAASGTHSVLMLRGLSEAGQSLCETVSRRFREQLPHQLSGPLKDLDPGLAAALLSADTRAQPHADLSEAEWREIIAFAYAARGYEDSHAAAWKLACRALADRETAATLDAGQSELLAGAVLTKRPWAETARALGLAGRSGCIEALRIVFRRLIDARAPAQILALRDRLRGG